MVLALAWGCPALAQETAAPVVISPVLTLNQEALFSRSAMGQRVMADWDQDRSALAAENRRIESELGAEEESLTERRADTSDAEFAALAAAFDEKVKRLRQAQDRKSRALQDRFEAERRNFTNQALPVIQEVARARGALVILDETAVLFAVESVDITSAVIAALDGSIGDGSQILSAPLQEQSSPVEGVPSGLNTPTPSPRPTPPTP